MPTPTKPKYLYIIIAAIGIITWLCSDLLVALFRVVVLWLGSIFIKDDDEPLSSKRYGTTTGDYGSSFQENQQKEKRKVESVTSFADQVIAEKNGLVNSNDLLPLFGLKIHTDRMLHKMHLDKVIDGLRKLGYGIVPNYLHGHKRFDYNEQCVLYKSHSKLPESLSSTAKQGELFLKLFSVILNGNQIVYGDKEYINNCLTELKTPEKYHAHLYAYIQWLMQKKQSYDKKTKDEVAELPKATKEKFVKLLLESISTNGSIDHNRLEALKKVLPTLDEDPASIHSLLHQSITSDGLATIEQYEGATEYTIRQPKEQKPIKKETSTIVLDEKKLGNLRQQTQIAQALLSDIFTEEEEVHLPDNNTSNAVIEALQKLLEKETWQRKEVQELLGANVMIGNMLEQINDYAYSKVDDIVVEEDGDTIYVTTEYKEQLI